MPSDPDPTRALPYLKAVVDDDGTPTVTASAEDSPVIRPFVGRLVTTYLVDEGDRFVYVSHRHVAAAGLTEGELHRRALRNLGQRVATGGVRTALHGPITAVLFDGNFEASLMVLEPLWPRIADLLGGGDLLAAAPARDILAVCPAHNATGRQELDELVDRVSRNGNHLLNCDLYLRRSDVWQALTPGDAVATSRPTRHR